MCVDYKFGNFLRFSGIIISVTRDHDCVQCSYFVLTNMTKTTKMEPIGKKVTSLWYAIYLRIEFRFRFLGSFQYVQ
jgi:hypothetical protein